MVKYGKNYLPRYLETSIKHDLSEKMVFVGGPRQVGKTTLALGFLDEPSRRHKSYLNWDVVQNRASLMRGELPGGQELIILDEIHKYAHWRNLVKGFFDSNFPARKFIITGSARLDYYSKGGDSLMGRYFYHRLHPFSLAEIGGARSDVDVLLRFGGFPEPLIKADTRFWRRWRNDRQQLIIREDMRDLELVREISLMELLAEELPHRVGSPLSVKKLSEALQASPRSVERWIQILERLYYCYRLFPFGSRTIRAVKKEKKLYLWDWSQIHESGPRFENMVASHLLKYCHFMQDTEGHRMQLRYIRDTDKREVDFVVIKNDEPVFAVESKSGEKNINPAIFYFKKRTKIERFYQVHLGETDFEKDGVRVLPFHVFSKEVGLV